MFFYVYPAWKTALRYFFFLLGHCLFGGLLLAGGGPVKEAPPEALLPPAPKTLDLNSLLSVRTEAEEAALAAYFSEAGTMSETGDDLRKLAALSDSARAQVDSARAVVNKILTEGRQIANLLDAQLSNLPLGITQQVGGMRITLAIAEARILPSGAEVDLILGIDFPDSDYDPIFKATGIPWSRSGGFVGEVTMQLIADWAIPINAGKSALFLHASDEEAENTFVRVNCEGFVAGRITASFILSRDWVLPVGSNGLPRALDTTNVTTASGDPFSPDRVRADFVFDLRADAGFFGETMLSAPFVFTGREDFIIDVGQVAVDFSDAVNPTDMQLPPDYTCAYMIGEDEVSPLWKGVYLRDIRLTMPSKFRREQEPALVVGAPYIIIDRQGFTAHIYAENPLPLGDKSASGWDFSVDYVSLKIVANQFQEAEMEGLLQVPLLSRSAENCDMVGAVSDTTATNRSDCLLYRAVVQRGNQYYFGVETQGSFCANIWQAQLEIRENSRIDLVYADDEFTATATLYGAISVNASVGESMSLEMDSIGFENVVLSTGAPYFSPGSWRFPNGLRAGIGPFTIGFDHISLRAVEGGNTSGQAEEVLSQVALQFQVSLEMDTALEMDARGAFRILGTVESVNGRQKYRFNRVKLDGFSIEASTSAFEVSAALAFYQDHESWGSGFYGAGSLFVTALGGAGIAAVAQFGQKNGRRYFFVDVMARFASGIPLGGMNLMAAGGGVFKGMTRADGAQAASFENIDDSHREQTLATLDQGDPLTGIVGISTSGLQYVVNPDTRFGAFIQVVVADPTEKAFSVNGRLELEIYETNGWRANIACNITIMGPINYTDDYRLEEGVAIYANIDIRKDSLQGLVLRASADVFVSLAGGSLNGGGATAPAANTDTDSTGIDASAGEFLATDIMTKYAGGVAMLFSRDDWFIHIGSTGAQLSAPNSDLPSVSGPIGLRARILGDTLGVSAYFCIGTIVPPLPPLPPEVLAITGQLSRERDEQMLANAAGFGMGAHLRLNIEGSAVIVYWRLDAGVGFDINVRNYGGLQCSNTGRQIGINGWYAGGQAYAYLDGEIGVKAPRFLGGGEFPIIEAGVAAVLELRAPNPFWGRGTVAGRFRLLGGLFKGSFRAQVEFGELCEPMVNNGEGDILDYIDVIVALSPAETADVNVVPSLTVAFSLAEPTPMSGDVYRIRLLEHKLVDAVGNVTNLQLRDNEADYVAAFQADSYLNANTTYDFIVQVGVEKCMNTNPTPSCNNWQQMKVEADTTQFTTGDAQDTLLADNILHTYPMAGMYNFYKDEHPIGFIKLERTQPNLVSNISAVFTTTEQQNISLPAVYNTDSKQYEFETQNLPNGQLLTWSLVNTAIPENTPGYTIFQDYFRSSAFNTFEDKLNAIFEDMESFTPRILSRNFSDAIESMDSLELVGSIDLEPLIQLQVTEQENYTTINDRRNRIFGNLPYNPPYFMDFDSALIQIWNGAVYEMPYENVFFTSSSVAAPPIVDQAYFDIGDNTTIGGGGFSLGFPGTVLGYLNELKDKAQQTAEIIIEDLFSRVAITNDVVTGPSGGNTFDLGQFGSCFPNFQSRVETCINRENGEGQMDTAQATCLEEAKDYWLDRFPTGCGIEPIIKDLLGVSPTANEVRGKTFPVRIKYRLPNGIVTTDLTQPFTIN